MYERFTEKSIKVILLAQEEARRLGCNLIDTEHILLGLIGEGTGNVATTLKSMGVNLKLARAQVGKNIGCSPVTASAKPFALDAKQPLEYSLAAKEALKFTLFTEQGLARACISTEHLLLCLLSQRQSGAEKILQTLGVDREELENRIRPLATEVDKQYSQH
ncbi:MAG: hypothetical protein KGS72_21150 [Cyanobacteria bacterium REEB67]|nr:hypothetical protein [Cyanobacteria bacterium REEB67]